MFRIREKNGKKKRKEKIRKLFLYEGLVTTKDQLSAPGNYIFERGKNMECQKLISNKQQNDTIL